MVTVDPASVAAASRGARPQRPLTVVGRRRGRGWGLTFLLLLAALTVLVPLYFAVVMAFKTSQQAVAGTGFSLPSPLNWSSFVDAWTLTGFARAIVVSAIVSAVSVLGVLLLASWASYAIVHNWGHRLFRWSYFYLLAAMFIPFPVVALPQVKLTAALGLANPGGVALLHVMFQLSFSVLLYSAFLRSIPDELEEAARMDGASTWQLFWRIILPLLAPMNATVGIFAFLASWNDYMMPSLITADQTLQTIPVVQEIFQSAFSTNYNVAFASYLMAMAPTIVVYVFAQRWVLSGVTRGAIK